MVALEPLDVADPRAQALLTDYFAMRAETFPAGEDGRTYRPALPDASVFTPPAGILLVLVDDDGRDAGCGGIRRVDDGALGIRYEIKHLYVAPWTRGRGWGRLVLESLEERARGFGAREIVLDTHHTLEAAGALYARSGYAAIAPYNDNPNATRWYAKPM